MREIGDETLESLRRRVSNDDQLAKIDIFQSQNGPGTGARYLAARTISGLRFRIAMDRGFDIDELEFQGQQMGWHGPTGSAAPWVATPDQEDGTGPLRGFSGFLVTCGYDYFGGPRSGPADHFGYILRNKQYYPLHGRAAFLSANLLVARIDWEHDEGPSIVLVAEMRQAGMFGENLCCTRTVTVPLGRPKMCFQDIIRNDGMAPSPHHVLYHINLGYPLIDVGTRIDGYPEFPGMPATLPALPQPKEETVRFEKREACAEKICISSVAGLSLSIYPRSPSFKIIGQWWNHYEGMECIGVEPASANMPSLDGGEWAPERFLEPGEREFYQLELELGTAGSDTR